jgi:lysyl endopeptidase
MTAIPSVSYDSMTLLNVTLENLGLLSEPSDAAESGLMSAFATGSWLPALPNGASVGPMPSTLHDRFVTLYDTFANAWRVNGSDSLFDYAPKTSTSTFTNTAWPVENAKTCTIPNQTPAQPVSAAVARNACKSISDKALYASCVFDVQATGVSGFADTYRFTENVHEALTIKPIDAGKLVGIVK